MRRKMDIMKSVAVGLFSIVTLTSCQTFPTLNERSAEVTDVHGMKVRLVAVQSERPYIAARYVGNMGAAYRTHSGFSFVVIRLEFDTPGEPQSVDFGKYQLVTNEGNQPPNFVKYLHDYFYDFHFVELKATETSLLLKDSDKKYVVFLSYVVPSGTVPVSLLVENNKVNITGDVIKSVGLIDDGPMSAQ